MRPLLLAAFLAAFLSACAETPSPLARTVPPSPAPQPAVVTALAAPPGWKIEPLAGPATVVQTDQGPLTLLPRVTFSPEPTPRVAAR